MLISCHCCLKIHCGSVRADRAVRSSGSRIKVVRQKLYPKRSSSTIRSKRTSHSYNLNGPGFVPLSRLYLPRRPSIRPPIHLQEPSRTPLFRGQPTVFYKPLLVLWSHSGTPSSFKRPPTRPQYSRLGHAHRARFSSTPEADPNQLHFFAHRVNDVLTCSQCV